jgi:hypothetical protein
MTLKPVGCWPCAPALTPIDKVIGKIKNFEKIVSLTRLHLNSLSETYSFKIVGLLDIEYVTAKNL